MKLLNVIGPTGEKLFTGTKRDCKMFIRANRIKRFTLKGQYFEKQVIAPDTISEPEPEPEVWFNEVFEKDE
jgi:hypothetical protein